MSALAVPASSLLPKHTYDFLPTSIQGLGGLPRGAISEFSGPRSSGKTSILISTLADATWCGEYCAIVDTTNRFDPASASRTGAALRNLLWVRCNHDAGVALKVVDALLHGGGFGLVCLDLFDVQPRDLNRLPLSYWFRFRRAVENTPTVLLVLSEQPNTGSTAVRSVECRQTGVSWTGEGPGCLLESLRSEAASRKPYQQAVPFTARAM